MDGPLPLELAGPARLRQVGDAAAAARQAADQLVADRAVAVGPDHVRGRRGVALEAGDEVGPGGHIKKLKGAVEGGRFAQREPGEGQRLGVVGAERLVDERPVVGLADLQHVGALAALHGDLLAVGRQRPPLVLEEVPVAVDPLDVEVLHVGHHVGDRPADVVALAHVDARHAGQGGAADEAPAAAQLHLLPDRGHARRQVRIAGDQRHPGHGTLTGHRPVVGAAGLGGEPERAPHRVDLLDQRQALAVPRRLVDDRVVARIGRVEARGQLGAELPHHVGAQQLALPVGAEPEGQQLAEAEDVDRAPRLPLEPEQPHLQRRRLGRRGARVHPGTEVVELGPQLRRQPRDLALGDPPDPQRPHQTVGRQVSAPANSDSRPLTTRL